jgi:dienelactone hydrolase
MTRTPALLSLAMALYSLPACAGQETVWISMPDAAAPGGSIKLEATLHRPAGSAPTPVVVFHHGSSGGPIPANYTDPAKGLAAMLNARGIALLVPMRSGRGKSEGPNNEEPSACTVDAARAGLSNAAKAVDATMAYLRTQPWVDMNRLAMAGHSRGGVLALTYASANPGVARGAINFSGGWKNDTCASPDINLSLFAAAGAKSTVPSLFLYAKGDGFYSDASMASYAKAYQAAGGKATFKLYTVSGINGHVLFGRAQQLWEADVDAFLKEIGMLPTVM